MMRRIDEALPAEQIGLVGHRPGSQINSVHLWSIANFWLLGRKIMVGFDPSLDDPVAAAHRARLLGARQASAHRGDGTRWPGLGRPPRRRPLWTSRWSTELMAGIDPDVDDPDQRRQLSRFNATLVNHLFLMWFDTRSRHRRLGPLRAGRRSGAAGPRNFAKLRAERLLVGPDVAAAVPVLRS